MLLVLPPTLVVLSPLLLSICRLTLPPIARTPVFRMDIGLRIMTPPIPARLPAQTELTAQLISLVISLPPLAHPKAQPATLRALVPPLVLKPAHAISGTKNVRDRFAIHLRPGPAGYRVTLLRTSISLVPLNRVGLGVLARLPKEGRTWPT